MEPETPAQVGFPIVGIGASAGGLAAFESFFSGFPIGSETGMAFVLLQHLAPDRPSILTGLVQRFTPMPVVEVVDGVVVKPNCVYVIPPGVDMAFLGGGLHLLAPTQPHGHRLPIDYFFKSLAADQHDRAIGIVLSGTGSDGTLGTCAIKKEGGMVLVQSIESAEYDGMPRSVIATGLADFVLPPAKMVSALVDACSGRGPRRVATLPVLPAPTESALKKLLVILRAQTGHDFSRYKIGTVQRRIERRMSVHRLETLDGYVKLLQQSKDEVSALFHDLLISVTGFFRDPDAFLVLESQAIAPMLARKQAGDAVRIWTAGCATGEEAYSIAILLAESEAALKRSLNVHIFATDIDDHAIAIARAGNYPATISADVSPERLAAFFTLLPNGAGYRVNQNIRDMLVFSEQDPNKDPPFSRLDLISCRNLLIYFGDELKERLIPLFHYALNRDGYLFLGTSETVGNFDELFAWVDRKARLYLRKQLVNERRRAALSTVGAVQPEAKRMPGHRDFNPELKAAPKKPLLRELVEQTLLRQSGQAAALVNRQGDILYVHGRVGRYLEPNAGEVTVSNIYKMAREGLLHGLTATLRKAMGDEQVTRAAGLRVKTNGDFTTVNLSVVPLSTNPASAPEVPLYLVILEDTLISAAAPVAAGNNPAEPAEPRAVDDARVASLMLELQAKDENLRSTIEQQESTNEELTSANEELQSVNEELHSTNEELETSKEELQSVNEELATVNQELHSKVSELSQSNNDMANLLAGTGIATVFVDSALNILRFTPAATEIFNFISTDLGRPVAHIASNLVGYDRLVADVQDVLRTLAPRALDVQTTHGESYTMRIQPYRTRTNVIEGAVVSFIDITEVVRTREALRKANELLRLAVVVRDAHDAITVQDLDGRILAWNPGAQRLYGWTESEAMKMNVRERIPPALQEESLTTLHRLSRAEVLEPYRTRRFNKAGAVLNVSIISTALMNEAGQMYAIATTESRYEAGVP